jgi:hypothetical protein
MAGSVDPERLTCLAQSVKYGGNNQHKKNPGDFGLVPPSQPRPDKTLCDEAGITSRKEALRLLREGARRGLISVQSRADFPQNIWAVTAEGIPLEAQLENREQGIYHGYPIPKTDDFRDEVIKRWNQS